METLVYRDRRGTNCVKWDILGRKYKNPDLLSMWIADMDFCAPECVVYALKEYVEQGIFGYHLPPASYEQAFIKWQRERFDFRVRPDWLKFSPGAAAALHFCISALTKPEDAIALMPPVYPAFLSATNETGRKPVACPLINNHGSYSIDFAGLEKAFAQEGVRLLIHCSPHNPVGRVWLEEELITLLTLCKKYNVFVVSDEVHQDLCQPGYQHIPLAKFEEFQDLVICITSPAKSFNLAGCRTATMIIPGEETRKRIDSMLKHYEITKGSSFSYIASEAAYTGGAEWLDLILKQIGENDAYIRTQLLQSVPNLEIAPLEGSFLLWLDFSKVLSSTEFNDFIEKECGLALNYGETFGDDSYKGFVRMNIATSRENVQLAVQRILSALQARGLIKSD